MKNLTKQFPWSVIGGLTVLLSACGGGGDSSPTTSAQQTTFAPAQIAFAARENGQPVDCTSTLTTVGTAANSSQLRDLRFYVSDVRLVTTQGQEVPFTFDTGSTVAANQTDNLALVSLIDNPNGTLGECVQATAFSVLSGTAPQGTYNGIRFTIGVPQSLNHSDTTSTSTPEPLKVQSMAWSWQSGRKFIKAEFNPTSGVQRPNNVSATTWNFHLGSTGCQTPAGLTPDNAVCSNSNRLTVSLDNFNPDKDQIILDLNALLAQSDITTDQGGALGCMSGSTDADCPSLFKVLGLTIQQDGSVTRDGPANFFSVLKNVR